MKSSCFVGAIFLCTFFISGHATSSKEPEEFKPYFSYHRTQETIDKIKDSLSGYTALVDTIQHKSNLSSEHKIKVIHQTNIPENAQITIQLTGTDIRQCKNIGWEARHIGQPNSIVYVKGFIETQRYENMKLQLELMELKSYPQAEIDAQRKALEVQQKLIQENYMNDENWAD